MKDTPINFDIVSKHIEESGLPSAGKASIREIKKLVDNIEAETGEKFIRMEMGIPGLPPMQIGVEAEIEALKKGVAAIYPDIFGIPQVKTEISRFVKLFMDIDVDPAGMYSQQLALCRAVWLHFLPLTACMRTGKELCSLIRDFLYINNKPV